MAQFPTSIPSYAGFTSSHTLSADNHAAQSNAEQGDIIALATKLGTGSSTPTSGMLLRGNGVGTTVWAQVNLATDVTNVLPQANGGTGGNVAFLAVVYPIGCIYTETTGVNPGITFGFGTWVAFGQGQVLVGNGTSDQLFTAGNTGGESSHILSSGEIPSHGHTVTDPGHTHTIQNFGAGAGGGGQPLNSNNTGTSSLPSTISSVTGITLTNTGGGTSHNNLQPYIVVYFWRRTT